MASRTRLEAGRPVTHFLLAFVTFVGAYSVTRFAPAFGPGRLLTLWYGYLSLLLLAITLLIGPLNLFLKRLRDRRPRPSFRNPVNLNLRRDTGIWCAITGCLHVYYAVGTHVGGQLLLYFVSPTATGYAPLLTLFGLSNYLGLVATLLLLLLLAISNDIFLRRLKGKRWKLLQRSNYLLFVLTLGHTFGYQALTLREPVFPISTLFVTATVLLAQSAGLAIYLSRPRSRPTHSSASQTPAS